MVAYIEPSVTLLFIFVFYFLCSRSINVLSHILQLCQFWSKSTRFFIYKSRNSKLCLYPCRQKIVYGRQEQEYLVWTEPILKKKVPRLPLTNCHFSVLFFKFLFFIIKLSFRLNQPKPLLLIHYILVMYSFKLHHLLLLQSGDIEINPGPMKSSTFASGISIVLLLMILLKYP